MEMQVAMSMLAIRRARRIDAVRKNPLIFNTPQLAIFLFLSRHRGLRMDIYLKLVSMLNHSKNQYIDNIKMINYIFLFYTQTFILYMVN